MAGASPVQAEPWRPCPPTGVDQPPIVDFAIQSHGLAIEPGGEHRHGPEGMARDRARDAKRNELGYRTHRINTGELGDNLDGCIETLLRGLGVT